MGKGGHGGGLFECTDTPGNHRGISTLLPHHADVFLTSYMFTEGCPGSITGMGGYNVEYDELKQIFEKTVCCIYFNNVEHFVRQATDIVSNVEVLQYKELEQQYMFLKCRNGKSSTHFISKWLNDENRRTVPDITCEPISYSSASFNLWKPFEASNAVEWDHARESLNTILHYMNELFGKEGSQNILDFFAFTVKEPGTRLDYALAVVGEGWYERIAIVHFFSHFVIGPYLSQRLVPVDTKKCAGLKLAWIDSHYLQREHETILDMDVVQAGKDPVWGLRNITNVIVTCEQFIPSDRLLVVRTSGTTPPSRFTSALRDEASPRVFYDYLLNEHRCNT